MTRGKKQRPRPRLSEREKQHIREVWLECDKNFSEAAKRCGVHRDTIKRHTEGHEPTMKALAVVEAKQAEIVVDRGMEARREHQTKIGRELLTAQDLFFSMIKQTYMETRSMREEAAQLREEYKKTSNAAFLEMALGLEASARAERRSLIKSVKLDGIIRADEYVTKMVDAETMNAQEQMRLRDGLNRIIEQIQDEQVRTFVSTSIQRLYEEIALGRAVQETQLFERDDNGTQQ